VDEPSIQAARRHAEEAGVADRARFRVADVAAVDLEGVYDAVVGFEFVHDLPHPVEVLRAMRRLVKPDGPVVVLDENVPDRFTGEPNDVERVMYGFSVLVCLPDGMSHRPTVATGTVIRADTMRAYAQQAGFADVEIEPIDHDLWRFYRLVHEGIQMG
jgi:2-polyprenyl-3-methyl-5-hydroxy-6-metoxy-1,4-benzoquinol methylase